MKTSILSGEVGVINVEGNLVGGDETSEFRRLVMGLLEKDYSRIILDFKNVTFVNSTGLGVLIAAHTSSVRKGCRIAICNLSKSVYSLLVITKLNLILNVQDSRDDALKSLL